MRKFGLALLTAVLTSVSFAQERDNRFNPSRDFTIDNHFFKMQSGRPIGSTAGISISPDGKSIWIFDRCGANDCVGSDLDPIMQFDLEGNQLASFGLNQLIPGWTSTLQKMVKGDIWELTIPSRLAYGSHSKEPIPPCSTLFFVIELLDIL